MLLQHNLAFSRQNMGNMFMSRLTVTAQQAVTTGDAAPFTVMAAARMKGGLQAHEE
jgi:hypothetical protein